MRAVDTNVLVRLLTRDDMSQWAAAERFVAGGAWVPTLAVLEAVWVLGDLYGLDAQGLCDAVELLLQNDRLVFQEREVVVDALATFRERPSLGFADPLILATARRNGHLPLGTFDRRLGRLEGAETIR